MNIKQLLGISLPIIQAPMAGVQGSALAIAVCEAGGLGSLPCATLSPDQMRAEINAIKAATGKPFNVNFFCHALPTKNEETENRWRQTLIPFYEELGLDPSMIKASPERRPFDAHAAELVEELRPAVVSFHFGLPDANLLRRVRNSGAKILASATTVEEARWLEARGVDAIIAQGLEAGGHRGMFLTNDATTQIGTVALVRHLIAAVKLPVIAAGGIADAEGVAAALALGAAGAQVGTAYLLCPEATTSESHRCALQSEDARHTALTNLFSGRLARGIVNRLMRELGPTSELAPDFPLASTALQPLRERAEATGRGDFSPLWSGQNANGCLPIPAGDLTRRLASKV